MPRREQDRSGSTRLSTAIAGISSAGLAAYLHMLLPQQGDRVCCLNDNGRRRLFMMQTNGSDRLPSEYWQTRADKVRAIADEMFDPQSRQTLFRIARDYEALARRAEERGSTLTAASAHR
jgi:hypothetical protein